MRLYPEPGHTINDEEIRIVGEMVRSLLPA